MAEELAPWLSAPAPATSEALPPAPWLEPPRSGEAPAEMAPWLASAVPSTTPASVASPSVLQYAGASGGRILEGGAGSIGTAMQGLGGLMAAGPSTENMDVVTREQMLGILSPEDNVAPLSYNYPHAQDARTSAIYRAGGTFKEGASEMFKEDILNPVWRDMMLGVGRCWGEYRHRRDSGSRASVGGCEWASARDGRGQRAGRQGGGDSRAAS